LPALSPADSSSPSTSATTPTPNGSPAEFQVAKGKAPPLQPAEDLGAAAGTEINDFAFDLLRRLDTKGNLCASPASIAFALAMVRPGARGATAAEMDKVLHSFGSSGQDAEIVALMQSLQGQTFFDDSNWYSDDPQATPDHTGQLPALELDVSNQVFSQQGMTLKPAFLDALSSSFGAGFGLLDFRKDPEAARQAINRWAALRTKNRIPEVLQPGDIDGSTRMALANAIYFKGGWTYPFDPSLTKSLPFTRADGSRVSVPTMATDHLLAYGAGKGYRAVELPFSFARGSAMTMTIVVPDDMASFVKGLNAARLKSLIAPGPPYDVDLTMPRFSADTRTELAGILAAMGMPTAFDPVRADFSGITDDEKLYITKVIHEANIDVVEEGTTAAAVTVAAMGTMGGGMDSPQHVKLNVKKPFLYLIREAGSGAIVFMGRIDDPSA
jgi:serpin B